MMRVIPVLADVAAATGGLLSLAIALVVGGVIGWLASIVMKTNAQMGLIANVVVGIVGSMAGHFLAGVVGIAETSTLGHLLVSLAGAIFLIIVLRFFRILR